MGDALRVRDRRWFGQVPAVGEFAVGGHGESAANTHTALDGFEASVDVRVGGPGRDGDVRGRAVDRSRPSGLASAPRRGRRPEQQRRDLSQQCSPWRSGQPYVRGFDRGLRAAGSASLALAPGARPARQGPSHQTTGKRGASGRIDDHRAPTSASGTARYSRRRPPRSRKHPSRLSIICAVPSPARSVAPATSGLGSATTAPARAEAPVACTSHAPD
jgi:hypothetical protein